MTSIWINSGLGTSKDNKLRIFYESSHNIPRNETITSNAARSSLLVLPGAAGKVLLVACANVANLLLARTAFRARDVAIRAAAGAGRLHLMRQFLTESLVLALGGGIAGLAIGVLGRGAILGRLRHFGASSYKPVPCQAVSAATSRD